jgi:hypothetical protein
MIWSSLFTIGSLLYGQPVRALVTGAVFVVSALVVRDALRTAWPEEA